MVCWSRSENDLVAVLCNLHALPDSASFHFLPAIRWTSSLLSPSNRFRSTAPLRTSDQDEKRTAPGQASSRTTTPQSITASTTKSAMS